MKVSLAVLRTTTIHQDGVSRSSILTSTIQNPATKVKLTGQILSMILAWKTGASDLADQPPMSATVRAANWLDSDADLHWGWIWNGEYLKVDSVMRGTMVGNAADKVATDKFLLVSVPGFLTEFVNPTTVDTVMNIPFRQPRCGGDGWPKRGNAMLGHLDAYTNNVVVFHFFLGRTTIHFKFSIFHPLFIFPLFYILLTNTICSRFYRDFTLRPKGA
jgi:hypothetical protein